MLRRKIARLYSKYVRKEEFDVFNWSWDEYHKIIQDLSVLDDIYEKLNIPKLTLKEHQRLISEGLTDTRVEDKLYELIHDIRNKVKQIHIVQHKLKTHTMNAKDLLGKTFVSIPGLAFGVEAIITKVKEDLTAPYEAPLPEPDEYGYTYGREWGFNYRVFTHSNKIHPDGYFPGTLKYYDDNGELQFFPMVIEFDPGVTEVTTSKPISYTAIVLFILALLAGAILFFNYFI